MSNATSARWVQWGRSTWHIQRDDETQTVCGRAVPEDARPTAFRPIGCKRCQGDADALAAAEVTRTIAWGARKRALEVVREDHRAGRFVVYRCRKCGAQKHPHQGGHLFCFDSDDLHDSDIEAVEVHGPAWQPEGSAPT